MKTVLIIVMIILIAGLLVGLFRFLNEKDIIRIRRADEEEVIDPVDEEGIQASDEEEVIIPVITTKSSRGPIADFFQTNGEIVSASSVDTYADVRGILATLNVELGDYVQANRVIAEVDPSQPGLTYALSPVRARVSGTITSLPFNRGDAVNTQTPIATIGDLSRLQAVAAIPERYISRIRVGLPAYIYLEAWPGYTIPARINEINPVVSPATRAMGIKMDIPPGESRVKAGMYAKLIITIEEKEDIVKIPIDAVLRRLEDTFVFVVEDDIAIKKSVVLGISQDEFVEVLDGIEAGETVVIQGQTLLEDAVKVRILPELQAVS